MIAEWMLEPGAGGGGPVQPLPLPIVLVLDDGRVYVSRSMFDQSARGFASVEGRLTTEQLEHFKIGLRKLTDGLEGKEIQRSVALHFPYHRFTIDLPDQLRLSLESSFRLIEMAPRAPADIYWTSREEANREPGLSRFEKLSQNYDPAGMAIRETFIAVEAQFLRAAAQAMINRELDPPIATQPTQGPSAD